MSSCRSNSMTLAKSSFVKSSHSGDNHQDCSKQSNNNGDTSSAKSSLIISQSVDDDDDVVYIGTTSSKKSQKECNNLPDDVVYIGTTRSVTNPDDVIYIGTSSTTTTESSSQKRRASESLNENITSKKSKYDNNLLQKSTKHSSESRHKYENTLEQSSNYKKRKKPDVEDDDNNRITRSSTPPLPYSQAFELTQSPSQAKRFKSSFSKVKESSRNSRNIKKTKSDVSSKKIIERKKFHKDDRNVKGTEKNHKSGRFYKDADDGYQHLATSRFDKPHRIAHKSETGEDGDINEVSRNKISSDDTDKIDIIASKPKNRQREDINKISRNKKSSVDSYKIGRNSSRFDTPDRTAQNVGIQEVSRHKISSDDNDKIDGNASKHKNSREKDINKVSGNKNSSYDNYKIDRNAFKSKNNHQEELNKVSQNTNSYGDHNKQSLTQVIDDTSKYRNTKNINKKETENQEKSYKQPVNNEENMTNKSIGISKTDSCSNKPKFIPISAQQENGQDFIDNKISCNKNKDSQFSMVQLKNNKETKISKEITIENKHNKRNSEKLAKITTGFIAGLKKKSYKDKINRSSKPKNIENVQLKIDVNNSAPTSDPTNAFTISKQINYNFINFQNNPRTKENINETNRALENKTINTDVQNNSNKFAELSNNNFTRKNDTSTLATFSENKVIAAHTTPNTNNEYDKLHVGQTNNENFFNSKSQRGCNNEITNNFPAITTNYNVTNIPHPPTPPPFLQLPFFKPLFPSFQANITNINGSNNLVQNTPPPLPNFTNVTTPYASKHNDYCTSYSNSENSFSHNTTLRSSNYQNTSNSTYRNQFNKLYNNPDQRQLTAGNYENSYSSKDNIQNNSQCYENRGSSNNLPRFQQNGNTNRNHEDKLQSINYQNNNYLNKNTNDSNFKYEEIIGNTQQNTFFKNLKASHIQNTQCQTNTANYMQFPTSNYNKNLQINELSSLPQHESNRGIESNNITQPWSLESNFQSKVENCGIALPPGFNNNSQSLPPPAFINGFQSNNTTQLLRPFENNSQRYHGFQNTNKTNSHGNVCNQDSKNIQFGMKKRWSSNRSNSTFEPNKEIGEMLDKSFNASAVPFVPHQAQDPNFYKINPAPPVPDFSKPPPPLPPHLRQTSVETISNNPRNFQINKNQYRTNNMGPRIARGNKRNFNGQQRNTNFSGSRAFQTVKGKTNLSKPYKNMPRRDIGKFCKSNTKDFKTNRLRPSLNKSVIEDQKRKQRPRQATELNKRYGKQPNKYAKLLKKVKVKYNKDPSKTNKKEKKIKKLKAKPKETTQQEHIDVNRQIFGNFEPIKAGLKKPPKGHLKPNPEVYWKEWWNLYGYVEKNLIPLDPSDASIKAALSFPYTPNDPEYRKRKRQLLVAGVTKMLSHIKLNETDYALRDVYSLLKYKYKLEDTNFQQHLNAKEMDRVEKVLKQVRKKTRRAFFCQNMMSRWHFSSLILKHAEEGETNLKCGHARKLLNDKTFNYLVRESVQELKNLISEDWPGFKEYYNAL